MYDSEHCPDGSGPAPPPLNVALDVLLSGNILKLAFRKRKLALGALDNGPEG